MAGTDPKREPTLSNGMDSSWFCRVTGIRRSFRAGTGLLFSLDGLVRPACKTGRRMT